MELSPDGESGSRRGRKRGGGRQARHESNKRSSGQACCHPLKEGNGSAGELYYTHYQANDEAADRDGDE